MVSSTTTKMNNNKDHLIRPYNKYNIYYILERELLIQTRSDASYCAAKHEYEQRSGYYFNKSNALTGYEYIELPPLPPRYQYLKLPHYWYMPGKKKNVKRSHTKTHGVASFGEIARTVGANWKTIDTVTLNYINEVAMILKTRHKQLVFMGGVGCFVAIDSRSSSPKQSPKKQHRTSLPNYMMPVNGEKMQRNTGMQNTRKLSHQPKSESIPDEMDLSTVLERQQRNFHRSMIVDVVRSDPVICKFDLYGNHSNMRGAVDLSDGEIMHMWRWC